MSQSAPAADTASSGVRGGQDTASRQRPRDAAFQVSTPLSPTMLRLTVTTMGGAALYGTAGAMVGSLEDESRCRRNNPGDGTDYSATIVISRSKMRRERAGWSALSLAQPPPQ
jgi:hypothetical protein